VVSTNDGSHFAAARALATRGTFDLGDGKLFSLNDTASGPGGGSFSDKPPGTALIAVPFYWLGQTLHPWLARTLNGAELRWHTSGAERWGSSLGYPVSAEQLVGHHTRETPQGFCTALAASLAGMVCCALTFRLARRLGAGVVGAGCATLSLGLGTLLWRYSTALFTHVFSATLLLLQLEWLLFGRASRSHVGAAVFGTLLGAALAVEYQALISMPLLISYWVWETPGHLRNRQFMSRLASCVAAAAVPVGLLLCYQWVLLGSPFRTTSASNTYFSLHSPAELLAGSPVSGAWFLLLAPRSYSLLWTSPILLMGAFGFVAWPRPARSAGLLMASIAVCHALAMMHFVVPWGGLTGDHRYLVRVLPLAAIPLAFAVDRWRAAERSMNRRLAAVLFSLALATSVYRSFEAVGHFGSHTAWLPGFVSPGVVVGTHGVRDLLAAAFPATAYPAFLRLACLLTLAASGLVWWGLRTRAVEFRRGPS
jgi:hypothetical protein